MFVAYILENYNFKIDNNFRDVLRFQENLESSLSHILKYTKFYIQSVTSRSSISIE